MLSVNTLTMFMVCLCVSLALVESAGLQREKRGLMEEADRIIKQNSGVDMNNVGQLADLVSKNGAEECLARVICELTQNPKSHGDAGNKFAQSLLKFRQSKHPKVKKYTDAMSYGAKAKNNQECKSRYAHCSHSTTEVVLVGNKIFKN